MIAYVQGVFEHDIYVVTVSNTFGCLPPLHYHLAFLFGQFSDQADVFGTAIVDTFRTI